MSVDEIRRCSKMCHLKSCFILAEPNVTNFLAGADGVPKFGWTMTPIRARHAAATGQTEKEAENTSRQRGAERRLLGRKV